MILERALRENKRVLLITPKSVAESVWNSQIKRQLQSKYGRFLRENYDLKLHTDLGRKGGISEDVETEIAEQVEEKDFLRQNPILKQVLIQRSRKYIKESEQESGVDILFPKRVIEPTVNYSLKKVYGSLYNELRDAFDRHYPFINLAIYNTVRYHKSPEKQLENRQKQIVGLIRTLVLKRLESSWRSFEVTIENLLSKMAKWLKEYAPERFDEWEGTNRRWWGVTQKHITKRLEEDGIRQEEAREEEDDITL